MIYLKISRVSIYHWRKRRKQEKKGGRKERKHGKK
jgi:hypothetical protein